MKNLSTRGWIIGILIGSWIATFVVGFLHVAGMFPEPENPIVHTFIDWIPIAVILLPISYIVARMVRR